MRSTDVIYMLCPAKHLEVMSNYVIGVSCAQSIANYVS